MMRFPLILLSLTLVASHAHAQDPTHMHKDDYMAFCLSKRDSENYCKCTLTAVDADIAKRKANMEKIIANENSNTDKQYHSAIKKFLRKRVVKDENEVQADCDVMRAHADGKISDAKYNEVFSGRKAGFYQSRMKKQVCFRKTAPESKTAQAYENKKYEYINASYIMTADNQCKRKHLGQN